VKKYMQKIIIASGPVIVRNGKVLLDKSGEDNFWKFCGGKVKDDKNLLETAITRAKEELGIDINILDQEPFLMYVKKPGDEGVDVVLVHFLADFSGEIVHGESENPRGCRLMICQKIWRQM
jgi:8-oxo-dGTP pyrophosphatase MutT (NUDIX family)